MDIEFAMAPRWIKGRASQAGEVALMRGPVVYCLNPVRNQLPKGLDLRGIRINPDVPVQGPVPDASVRPGGTSFRIRAVAADGRDLDLVLTELPDVGGEATYVLAPGNIGEEDELFGKATK